MKTKGLLVENALLALKPWQFFWRDAYNHEVDFVEIKNKQVLPVEVKYKTKIRNSDLNNLFLFCKKFHLKHLSDYWSVVIFVSPEDSHIYIVFVVKTKIWNSEGFLIIQLSDECEIV